jgi:hypothetical protein
MAFDVPPAFLPLFLLQVCGFLREFNVAVANIDMCLLSTGCFAFVEFHRGADTDTAADGDEDEGEGDADQRLLNVTDRFGPWSFTHVVRKRSLAREEAAGPPARDKGRDGGGGRDGGPVGDGDAIAELVNATLADAVARCQGRLVTYSSVMISEAGCHAVRRGMLLLPLVVLMLMPLLALALGYVEPVSWSSVVLTAAAASSPRLSRC